MKLIATDLTMLTGEAMVTIALTDANEAPSTPRELKGALEIDGDADISYDENDMDAVATYRAIGPLSDSAVWSLSGDDMSRLRHQRRRGTHLHGDARLRDAEWMTVKTTYTR